MNGNLKRSRLLAAVLLVCVGLTPAAQGASFDCGKAGTKVEHIICDNPEISKLDDELVQSYKAALQNKGKAEGIKQAQRQWLKERDACADAGCVQDEYRNRMGQLQPTQNVTAHAAAGLQNAEHPKETSAATATVKKYPPYPDVWDWVMPDQEIISEPGVDLVGMDTGDILISYVTHDANDKWTAVKPLTLFGHLTTDEHVGTLIAKSSKNNSPLIKLSDGTSAHIENKDESFQYILHGIPLGGGRKLNQSVFQQIGHEYASCYRGPARGSYYIVDAKRKPVRSVVIFKLLDKPKRIDIGKGCISESEQSFTTRVESIDGLQARALADGGFVMQVEPGVLIRFDKDFNSRSSLINNKYFVLDNMIGITGAEDDEEPETDYWIYINRINGKRYRQGPQFAYDYQSVVDDLYNYLLALKANKGISK